jgi:hypothetical protein
MNRPSSIVEVIGGGNNTGRSNPPGGRSRQRSGRATDKITGNHDKTGYPTRGTEKGIPMQFSPPITEEANTNFTNFPHEERWMTGVMRDEQ